MVSSSRVISVCWRKFSLPMAAIRCEDIRGFKWEIFYIKKDIIFNLGTRENFYSKIMCFFRFCLRKCLLNKKI